MYRLWGNEMKIESVNVRNDGYVDCKSGFYTSQDLIYEQTKYSFTTGINWLIGEIDSGCWAVSYLLSMYKWRPKDFILFRDPQVTVNDTVMSLDEISKYTCYLNRLYPLFSTKRPIEKLVMHGIKKNKLDYSPEEIRDLFHMDSERFTRPLTGVGHEIFRAMAAIGYVHNKQVFCFPWLSKKRYDGYNLHMPDLMSILESLKMIVIVPRGQEDRNVI